MDQQSTARLREELSKITAWMARQETITKFLSTPYEEVGTEYQERVSN
jgi:hypothetical protein